MAMKDSRKLEFEDDNSAPVKPAASVNVVAAKKAEPAVIVSFDRWFAATGRPQHHKAGMQAFASTKGKKTIAAWQAVFAAY